MRSAAEQFLSPVLTQLSPGLFIAAKFPAQSHSNDSKKPVKIPESSPAPKEKIPTGVTAHYTWNRKSFKSMI